MDVETLDEVTELQGLHAKSNWAVVISKCSCRSIGVTKQYFLYYAFSSFMKAAPFISTVFSKLFTVNAISTIKPPLRLPNSSVQFHKLISS